MNDNFEKECTLIAEFMQETYIERGRIGYVQNTAICTSNPEGLVYEEMKYHLSFDWLMPVIDRIISLGWQFQLNSYKVSNDAMFISGESSIRSVAWSTPLLATYNLVIDFIKSYNTQTSSN